MTTQKPELLEEYLQDMADLIPEEVRPIILHQIRMVDTFRAALHLIASGMREREMTGMTRREALMIAEEALKQEGRS